MHFIDDTSLLLSSGSGSGSQCCCCSSSSSTPSRRKRARPTTRLVVVTAALALFLCASSSAFQPLVRGAGAAPRSSSLKASTVAPPVPKESSGAGGGLWGGGAAADQQRGDFHWPWEQHHHREDEHRKKEQQQLTPKDVWVQKYCTVEGLREAFGRNRNVLWGDLDAANTRRLYKTLMPVALMELYHRAGDSDESAVQPQDLAVLAYKARVAAKLYARERCRVPGRVAANLFDGYRQWRKYGSFDCTGMSYQQVWEKYAALIQQETADGEGGGGADDSASSTSDSDVTEQICLKILERSCQSNAMIDEMVLNKKQHPARKSRRQSRAELQQLERVQEQLEQDVRLLLLPPDDGGGGSSGVLREPRQELHRHNIHRWSAREAQKFRALRAFAKFKRRMAWLQNQNHQHHHHPIHDEHHPHNEAKNHHQAQQPQH